MRAIRRIGAQALATVYGALRKGRPGGHDTVRTGVAIARPDETRPWQFGDGFDVDVVKSLLNAVKRNGASAPIAWSREDLEVREMDYQTQCTTVLLLDLSWSMSWAGRFGAAKRVAIALDHLIRTRYPRGRLQICALLGLALVVLVASGFVLAKNFLNYDLGYNTKNILNIQRTAGSQKYVSQSLRYRLPIFSLISSCCP